MLQIKPWKFRKRGRMENTFIRTIRIQVILAQITGCPFHSGLRQLGNYDKPKTAKKFLYLRKQHWDCHQLFSLANVGDKPLKWFKNENFIDFSRIVSLNV